MEQNTPGRMLMTTRSSLEIIEAVVQEDGATATDLAEKLDLAHSTIHNHLSTLSQHGYIVRESNMYYAGAKFCHIGDYVRRRKPEYLIADDIVTDLAHETELEADFAVEENGHIISLYNELKFSDTSHFLTEGRFFHLHSTASGKAVLAEYPKQKVLTIIQQTGLPEKTDATITNEDDLLTELEKTRERGYAISNEEAIEGLWSIAKVVKTPLGNVCGSLNLSCPTYLYSEEISRSAAEILERHAATFEDRIETKLEDMYKDNDG